MRKPYYTAANLKRENSVGYLVKRCGVLMTQIAERRFEKTAPVTFTQWLVLIRLSDEQEQISATQLSRDLGHDMGALTRVVDELERRGLAQRERSRTDRRVVEIAITPAGRRIAQDTKRGLVELQNGLAELYRQREFETLISLLQRLWQHLEREAAEVSAEAPAQRAAAGRVARRPSAGGTA